MRLKFQLINIIEEAPLNLMSRSRWKNLYVLPG